MSLPSPTGPVHSRGGYGPLGTPDAGRAERVARESRRRAHQYRAAAKCLVRNPEAEDRELWSLRQEVRHLRDQLAELEALRDDLAELRARLPELVAEQVQRIIGDELPEAVAYLTGRPDPAHNGRPLP